MTNFRTAVTAAGILLAFTLVAIPARYCQAQDSASISVDVAAPVPALQSEVALPDDAVVKSETKVVKRKKKHKKRALKKSNRHTVEMSFGGKLSISQVQDILKTTRDLSGKNLSGLQLVGINLSKCNLKGIDLSNANLERADFGESQLERADLSGANLKMVNLRASGMTAANLDRATLDGAIWKDGTICPAGSVGQCRELAAPSYGK